MKGESGKRLHINLNVNNLTGVIRAAVSFMYSMASDGGERLTFVVNFVSIRILSKLNKSLHLVVIDVDFAGESYPGVTLGGHG